MSIGDSSITFYHLASRQAHLNDSGSNGGPPVYPGLQRGLFFYEHRAQLHHHRQRGRRAASITSPSPRIYRGYTNDSSVWSEWQDVSSQVDWVISHISMIHVSESSPAADLDVNSLASSVSNIGADSYIVPDSSSRTLSSSELSGLSAAQLQMAINEIYARNHRRFDTPSIQSYFRLQDLVQRHC